MPDAKVDPDDRGPGARVDVASPADGPAMPGQNALRGARASWMEPGSDAADELVDTRPRHAVAAAPISVPLAPDAAPRHAAVRVPGDVELSAPPTDVKAPRLPAESYVGTFGEPDARGPAAGEDWAETEPAGSVATNESGERGAGSLVRRDVVGAAGDDGAAADDAPASARTAEVEEADPLGELTLIPDTWHTFQDEVTLAAETDDASSDVVDSSPETDGGAVETYWLAGEPTLIVEGTLAPPNDRASVEGARTEGAAPGTLDGAGTSAQATAGVREADATEGLLYGYASAPTRPRAMSPSAVSLPPRAPLSPPLSPPLSAWSVSVDGAAARRSAPPPVAPAGPLHPPLPVAASAAPRPPAIRVPSIAGVDTRVPQEYWIEDDPMELTRLSLGLSSERPVVREAGRPLPKPRRFKRPPRGVSLLVFLLVLALVLLAAAGVVVAIEHLLTQPAPTPIVVPTHTALPTSTPTQGS
jgi:hypothetical protein